MSETNSFEEMQRIGATARGLRTFFDAYRKASSLAGVDKYAAGFSKDRRFSVFERAISFDAIDAYTGVFGQSTVGVFRNGIDSDLASAAFAVVVEDLKEEIFRRMADYLEGERAKLVGKAKAEANAILDAVAEIEADMLRAES